MVIPRKDAAGGFTLIEILIVVAIISILASIAIPLFNHIQRKARTNALLADAKILFEGFLQYSVDRGEYPPCCDPPEEAFAKDTLWPLTRHEYIGNPEGILSKLQGYAVSDYDSPDNPSTNHDFYALLVHRRDGTLRVLLADTDEHPDYNNQVLYGIYLIEEGTLLNIADR